MVQPDICRLIAATMERRKKKNVVSTGHWPPARERDKVGVRGGADTEEAISVPTPSL